MLTEKSDMNYKTGEWAENKSFFDIAISRYYYSIYQKIIYILKKNNKYINPPKGENSHIFTINLFIDHINNKLDDEDMSWINEISKIREHRNLADYNEDLIPKNQFILAKITISNIHNIIKNL